MVSLRNIISAVVIASAATIIAGCTAHPSAFSHYARIDESGWRYDDTLRFTPDIPPAVSGELRLGLRHNGNYPYRNLWVEVTTPVAGDSSAVRRDTVSVELADKYGRWNGTGQCSCDARRRTCDYFYKSKSCFCNLLCTFPQNGRLASS